MWGFFIFTEKRGKIDYKDMRALSDEIYAQIVKLLLTDEKVKLFQQLLLAPKIQPENEPAEKENKDNGNQ